MKFQAIREIPDNATGVNTYPCGCYNYRHWDGVSRQRVHLCSDHAQELYHNQSAHKPTKIMEDDMTKEPQTLMAAAEDFSKTIPVKRSGTYADGRSDTVNAFMAFLRGWSGGFDTACQELREVESNE